MGERLGTMSLTVELNAAGEVSVLHGTDFSVALDADTKALLPRTP